MELASMDNYFDGIALKFAEQTNRKIVSFLGSGEHGNAYLTDDDKVVKVTTDLSEYSESRKLLNANPIHLPKIYDCYVVESKKLKRELPNLRGMWVILLEKVNHDEIKQKELFYGLMEAFEEQFDEDFFGILSYYHTNNISTSKMLDYLRNIDIEPEWEDYFTQLIEMIDELKKYNIKSVDYGPANFGFRGNTLVYFDIGFGDEENDGIHKTMKF
jgi:hypothetical protein